jgi:hypothetical protein
MERQVDVMVSISFLHLASAGKKLSTEKVVQQVRKHYPGPQTYYMVGSDAADDLLDITTRFTCHYKLYNTKLGYPSYDSNKTIEWLSRFRQACLECRTSHIMMMEDDVWIKNCLSIGLAASFSEPLEATSIHATIVQLTYFVFEYLRDTLNDTYSEGTAKAYNRRVGHMYDTFMDFINVHYMGGRNDSEFWKYIGTGATQTEFVANLLDMCKHRSPNHSEFMGFYGYAGWSLWSYVLAGTGHLTPEIARKELEFYGKTEEAARIFNERHRSSTLMFSRQLDNTQFLNLVRNSINIQGEKKYGN